MSATALFINIQVIHNVELSQQKNRPAKQKPMVDY